MEKEGRIKYGLAVAPEKVSAALPIALRGEICDVIRQAKEYGYDGVEIQLRNPETLDRERVLACCRETGMEVCAISTGLEYTMNGLSMIDDDIKKRQEARRRLFLDVELAAEFGCPVIIGCIRGNIPENGVREIYVERFREEMQALADKAAAHGVTIVLEAINFYVNNYLNTVHDTLAFISSLDRDNVKIHIDTHHMVIEEKDLVASIMAAGDRIGYVHFAENNRLYPGAGSIRYMEVMGTLKAIGYRGYASLEIVPVPDEESCAKWGIHYLKQLETVLSTPDASVDSEKHRWETLM